MEKYSVCVLFLVVLDISVEAINMVVTHPLMIFIEQPTCTIIFSYYYALIERGEERGRRTIMMTAMMMMIFQFQFQFISSSADPNHRLIRHWI
jgi:hypothetical protein